MSCSELVVVVESATKPSRFAHCSHGALVSCSVVSSGVPAVASVAVVIDCVVSCGGA